MTAPFLTIPDIDEDWKDFLVNQPNLAPLHGGRVYFRLPNNPVYPLLRTYRAGGGKSPGEPNVLQVRFAVEVLHNQITGAAYLAVRQIVGVLESVVDSMTMTAQGNTMFLNGIAPTVTDKPDPDTGWPGRVVDCLITLRTLTD